MLKKIAPLFLALIVFFVSTYTLHAQDQSKTDLQNKIQEYEKKLGEIKQQKDTLSSQIQLMDTQILLTELKSQETERKIESTEKEMDVLGARIDGLDSSLDKLSTTMLDFVINGYKQRNVSLFDILLDAHNASDLMSKVKYYSAARRNNEKILLQVQETKINFEEQKDLRERKIKELDVLKETLIAQHADIERQQEAKRELLSATQNDEKTYQSILSQLRSEYAAIQGIVSGAGTETSMREVKKGDSIASVISGASCNSSGSHLHFIVQEGGGVTNPFNYLKSVDHTDYAGDPWTPSGNWDWPVSPSIQFYQGYGSTNCVRNGFCGRIYSSHNGLDIRGSSDNVTAVADGTLYRGSYAVGCTLPYVKLVHKESNITTLYLHVYAQ